MDNPTRPTQGVGKRWMSKPGRTNKIWNEHWFRWWNSQVWRALLVVSDSFVVCCLFSNDFFGLMIGKIYIYIFLFGLDGM